MFRNYLKTAIRGLLQNTAFTLINILGLALGLVACLLIVLFVFDELSFDRYNTKADRVYRVNEDLKLGDNKVQYAVCMAPLAQTLKSDFPEVENAGRLKKIYIMHVKKGNETLIVRNALWADPSIFDIFTLPVIYGNKATALTEPNTVVLTESEAQKYFNKVNALGQSLIVDNNRALKVTAIIKDIPKTSHLNAGILISMASFNESRSAEWLRSEFNTYVLLRPGASAKRLQAQFPQLLRKYSGAQMQNQLRMSVDQFEKSGSYFKLNLIPLTSIHLHSDMNGELSKNGNVQYVYIFSAIALFILVTACVNFMNLSTARSSNRAREVGVRKVLGSPRSYLIIQFLTESTLVTLIAMVIAVTAALMLLPFFNQLADKDLVVNAHTLIWLLPGTVLAVLVVGLISGSYPAFFLSAFQPIVVLKGRLSSGFKGSNLRNILVVFQFCISIFLIIGTLVIYNQLNYIQSRDIGYNRNQVLVIHNAFELGDHAKTFKKEIKQVPGVKNATLSGFLPTDFSRSTSIFYKVAVSDPKQSIFPQSWSIDDDYIKTLGMKMVAGRSFTPDMPTDSTGLVINESAAKFLGFSDPINKILYQASGTNPLFKPYHIIGVVKDFNFNSLRENVSPVFLTLNDDFGDLSLRVETHNLPALLSLLQQKWKSFTPAHFEYSFMDADFDASYRSEQRMGHIFIIFASLAIIVACLGLFGLAAYAAEQRAKEIGIRKVLGAEVSAIVRMLSGDFIKLVVVAMLIASPLAWWAMHKWLQNFAYRINIHWWVFAAAGLTAILVALITISFQSIKAALANPITSLRNE